MYSPQGTNITVSAWVTDLLFTITIADNGIGIKELDIDSEDNRAA